MALGPAVQEETAEAGPLAGGHQVSFQNAQDLSGGWGYLSPAPTTVLTSCAVGQGQQRGQEGTKVATRRSQQP